MTQNRRQFLQMSAAAGGIGLNVVPGAIERALAVPARRITGTIKDVRHIVVLMQENRSFDHLFGTMRGVRGFGDPRPARLPSGATVFEQPYNGGALLPFHPGTPDFGMQYLDGTPHDWTSSHAAWNLGRHDAWVAAKGTTTMTCYRRDDVPFHYALADAFTVCDAYHCSLMGPTDPNRYHLWTGWVGNDGTGGGPVVDNAEAGYGWSTFPEKLDVAGISWKVYQDAGVGLDAAGYWGWTEDACIGNYGDNSLLYFHQYQDAQPGSSLYEKARTGTQVMNGDPHAFFDVLKADVAAGTLPQVSWIVAPEAYSEHPNWIPNYGAWYVSQVLDILASNPDVWSQTALFVTYDENDGLFDHVVPPTPPANASLGRSTVDTTNEIFPGSASYPAGPYGLGQRVPMMVVSPWSRGGWVCSEVFDHTSLIRFIEKRFDLASRGLAETNITPWRRAVVGDLTSAFDFAHPNESVPALPPTTGYLPPDDQRHDSYVPQPPARGRMPRQEPGLKWSRALPYLLDVQVRVDATRRTIGVRLANPGRAAAVFRVSVDGSADAPKTYTVEADKQLHDAWSAAPADGRYGLVVTGPGAYHREFAGDASIARQVAPEVAIAPAAGGADRLHVVITNAGSAAVQVVLRPNAYTTQAARTYWLEPGAVVEDLWSVGDSYGWYDLSATCLASPVYLRRAAGRVEYGQRAVSDPATLTRG
jgi:phospholipase C